MNRVRPIPGPVLIIGASHQGEVVLDLLKSLAHPPEVLGFLDSGEDGSFIGKSIGGLTVLDSIAGVDRYQGRIGGALPAVGDAAAREKIVAVLTREQIPIVSAIHPSAVLAGDVVVGGGAVVHAGAILGVGVRVGTASIVNTAAVVEHHCHIGDYAHVAPGARLAGGVRVGERAWIGIGATVLEGLAIGPDAMVGAGAVVNRDVRIGATVVGVPARPLGQAQRLPEKDLA